MEERRQDYPDLLKNISDIKTDVKDIKYILNGNGKIGLSAKVQFLWSSTIFIIVTLVGILIKIFIPKN